jgi:diacylglycerol kinase (ATP)
VPCGDWLAALDVIAGGEVRHVDAGRCGNRRFLSVAGAGLDSRVALIHQRLPRLLQGTVAYSALVLAKLFTGRPMRFRIAVDGEKFEQHAWMVAVANMERYAGGMRIAPEARPDDGRLHVCVIGHGPRREVVRAFPRVFQGTHTSHPMVQMLEAKAVYLSCDEPTPVIADGEHVGWLPTTFAVEPRAVALLCPKAAETAVTISSTR